MSASSVLFYPSHLLLDARSAFLDDGVLHVTADHITLDLRAKRYVAIGNVTVSPSEAGGRVLLGPIPTPSPLAQATAPPTLTPAVTVTTAPSSIPSPSPTQTATATPIASATSTTAATPTPSAAPAASAAFISIKCDVFAEDMATRHGAFVRLEGDSPLVQTLDPGSVGAPRPDNLTTSPEPLALPDLGNEAPFASATRAVAHLGADVRLSNARVIVPGARSVPLPSYVYLYSSDPGYTVTNFAGAAEDLPIYFGSTRNSVQGIHFIYRPDVKFSFGLDQRFVNGPKSYVLLSGLPLTGRNKALTATWQDAINGHTQQTLTSTAIEGFGTSDQYDVRDGVHRSFFELTATQFQSNVDSRLAWQSYDQGLAHAGVASHLFFHLRSEYGVLHTPLQFGFPPLPTDVYLPQYIFHLTGEAYLATQPIVLGPDTTTYASADARYVHDTLPHNLSTQTFGLTLNQRVNHFVTLGANLSDTPLEDGYPRLGAVYASRFDTETATFSYNHSGLFSLLLTGTHATASTQLPAGLIVTPWSTSADLRFRVLRTLSVELGRSYYFGFEGQRFGTWSFQIFP